MHIMRLVADQLPNPDTVITPTGNFIMLVFAIWTLKEDKYRVCGLVSNTQIPSNYSTTPQTLWIMKKLHLLTINRTKTFGDIPKPFIS